jgi:uncharacterized protein (TIGR02271 family)
VTNPFCHFALAGALLLGTMSAASAHAHLKTATPAVNSTVASAPTELRLAFTKDRISDAPDFHSDEHLSESVQQTIYRHYGLEGTDNIETYESDIRDHQRGTAGFAGGAAGAGGAVHDRDRVDAADAVDTATHADGDSITRSEERLVAGTRREEAGTARLRKYVVTEQEHVTVPVQHEEVTLDREPITDGNVGDAFDGPAISESEHEVTLHAERAVVDTEAVPVERVRLGKKVVTDEETVSGEVRKEQVEFDGTDGRRN